MKNMVTVIDVGILLIRPIQILLMDLNLMLPEVIKNRDGNYHPKNTRKRARIRKKYNIIRHRMIWG